MVTGRRELSELEELLGMGEVWFRCRKEPVKDFHKGFLDRVA